MKTGRLESLSAQNLLDCVRTGITDGCWGGLEIDAYNWIQRNGIMSDASYPYEEAQRPCRFVTSKKIKSTIVGVVQLDWGSETQLKNAVATVGPVSVAMFASLAFMQFYSEGIFFDPFCNPFWLNHVVLAVGYGTEKGRDYWLLKNSWGTEWGGKKHF